MRGEANKGLFLFEKPIFCITFAGELRFTITFLLTIHITYLLTIYITYTIHETKKDIRASRPNNGTGRAFPRQQQRHS